MKTCLLLLLPLLSTSWIISPSSVRVPSSLSAEIRGPTSKSKELRFGWDGTTALGGAVDNSKPARLLSDIKASGETLPPDAELFLQNMEMDKEGFTFQEFLDMINSVYETGLIEFRNGGVLNKEGENEGTAHVLSFAALADLSDEQTLLLWAEHYRDTKDEPEGDSHQNIREFMRTGMGGVDFSTHGISLTKKVGGDAEWDWDAESWIP